MVERYPLKVMVGGSSPPGLTKKFLAEFFSVPIVQWKERWFPEPKIESSNLSGHTKNIDVPDPKVEGSPPDAHKPP